MRLPSFLSMTILCLLIPAALWATSQTYNEAAVERLEGTIMVQRNDGSKPFALETGSTVQKGDTLTVYERSWVILKTHKGDRIGIDGYTDGNSVVAIDEYYIEGPDRQIRLILNKGNLLLRTNGSGSRQSFFEVNTGSVVTSVNDTHSILNYDPVREHLRVQYFEGKLSVIDKDNEQKFQEQHIEHNWDNGKMTEEEGVPVDELDLVNYNRFFDAEDPLESIGNNILLGSGLGGFLYDIGVGGKHSREVEETYERGKENYNKGLYREAANCWEATLAIEPNLWKAKSSLKKLAEEHPELHIDESELTPNGQGHHNRKQP